MPEEKESSPQSYDINHSKIPCDKIIASAATCATISCIIGYFIYLGWWYK
jgi:hypothetical protein